MTTTTRSELDAEAVASVTHHDPERLLAVAIRQALDDRLGSAALAILEDDHGPEAVQRLRDAARAASDAVWELCHVARTLTPDDSVILPTDDLLRALR